MQLGFASIVLSDVIITTGNENRSIRDAVSHDLLQYLFKGDMMITPKHFNKCTYSVDENMWASMLAI